MQLGQAMSTGALSANDPSVADVVVEGAFLIVEGGHDVADPKDKAAEVAGEKTCERTGHADGSACCGNYFYAHEHFADGSAFLTDEVDVVGKLQGNSD